MKNLYAHRSVSKAGLANEDKENEELGVVEELKRRWKERCRGRQKPPSVFQPRCGEALTGENRKRVHRGDAEDAEETPLGVLRASAVNLERRKWLVRDGKLLAEFRWRDDRMEPRMTLMGMGGKMNTEDERASVLPFPIVGTLSPCPECAIGINIR